MNNERAIEVLKNYVGCYLGNLSGEEYEALELAIKALERPQGEWVDTNSGYKCSVCGESNDYAYDEYKHKFTDYYCPNCGAKMTNS